MILLLTLAAAGLLFWLQFWLYQRYWSRNLRVTLRFAESMVYEKEESILEEVVENQKWLPLPVLKVKFQCSRALLFGKGINSAVTDFYYRNDVFTALPMKRITRRLNFLCSKRGYYGIRGIDLISTDLFFCREFLEEREGDTYLYVLPRPYATEEFTQAIQKINGEALAKRHLLEDPFELRGIREYQPYDSVRCVNWKATARTGSLMVNQRNYTALRAVRIFLNLDDHSILRQVELLEVSIRIAAELSRTMLEQGIRVSLYANAPDVINGECLEIGASAGAGQLEVILKGLARLDLDNPALSYEETLFGRMLNDFGDTCTVVVSPNVYEEFQRLLVVYGEQDADYFWLCPRYETKGELKLLNGIEQHFMPIRYERE